MRLTKQLTLAACMLAFACGSQAADKPNILWIITDDHRADSIQAYNRATTGKDDSALGYVMSPYADRLAKAGVLFTRAYCNSPGCAPSRTSMHYGMYPHRCGHYGFEQSHQSADFTKPTLPRLMSNQGYSTALFGKSGYYVFRLQGKKFAKTSFYDVEVGQKELYKHGHTDWAKEKKWKNGQTTGTEVFWGFPDAPVRLLTPVDGSVSADLEQRQRRVEKELNLLHAYARENATLVIGGVSPRPTDGTQDGQIVAAFEDFLRHRGKTYRTPWKREIHGPAEDKPLFVHLGFHFPHTPVLPSREFREQFAGKRYRVPDFGRDELKSLPPQLVDWFEKANFADMKPEDKQQAIRDYYAFCAMGDSLVGRSVEAFKNFSRQSGRDYLILYVIGDHGWHLGEQGGETKFAPYDASNHCAVIAVSSDKQRWPAGKVCHDWVEFVDFSPTILRAGGADLEDRTYAHLDGIPLNDTLSGKAARDYVIGEMNQFIGPRAYLRCDDFAFSMRVREKNGKPGDKWGHPPGEGIKWGLEARREAVEMALFDLRNDADERHNVANDPRYVKLADWLRDKLGRIVLGDGRVECDWKKENEFVITDFARGAHDRKLDIPGELVPKP